MNSTLKTIIYLVLGFMVVSLVARLFFSILPYFLLIGIIIFAYFKIRGYFIKKRMAKASNNNKTYNSNNESQYSAATLEEDDDVVSDVIDVDYKEVE